MPAKQVICVRDDLDLSPGKLAVQVAHGAVDAALAAKADRKEWFAAWRRGGKTKVCVRVPDEEALHELQVQARAAAIPHSLVRDAGRTEVEPGTVTALALGPAPEEVLDPLTRSLTLM